MTEQNQPTEGEQSWEPQKWEPRAYEAEPAQPAAAAPTDPYGQPPAPEYTAQAPTDPYGQPPAPEYTAQAPTDPYGAPPSAPYVDPQASYGQPPVDPYAQQPGGAYAAPTAPPPGYGVPAGYGPQMNPAYNAGPNPAAVDNLKLNYWLSVFFSWIPALIFMLTEKDKNELLDDHLKENMNFQITRVIAWAIVVIPVIGWAVGGLASIVLFVFAIMGAMKAPDEYLAGRAYRFPFAIRIIK